uniref:DNA polymerase III subunit gamma/tau n=1 Tax=candidate division CPR3 bacterium TaxID=2268181 RepID=A0A7C5URL8_UNCC3
MLYRKYRPKRFSDVVGQDIVSRVLKKAISTNKIGHAYLFSGPRGVGKTTLARLIAKAVNCLNRSKLDKSKNVGDYGEPCNKCEVCKSIDSGFSTDVLEIDAASNRGIDEIRDLREKVKFPPLQCKYKVYIIDEVHMLTKEAFNALLKTLEEPPAHAVFILCTTEPQKVPETIISRCQWYNLRLGTQQELEKKLLKIAKEEGVDIEEDAIKVIAGLGEGSFRDAESIFSMILSAFEGKSTISLNDVRSILKLPSKIAVKRIVSLVSLGRIEEALRKVNAMKEGGFNGERIIDDIINEIRNKIIDSLDNTILLKRYLKILNAFLKAKKLCYLFPDPYGAIEFGIVEGISRNNQQNEIKNFENGVSVETKKDKKDKSVLQEGDEFVGKDHKINDDKVDNTLRNVMDHWKDVVKEACRFNSHLSTLLESAIVKEVNGDRIVISVPNNFCQKALESTTSQKRIFEITKKIFGEGYKIRCVVIDERKKLKDLTEEELKALLGV